MSNALHRQVPINGTIQSKVPPGNTTNLYYILVSNLPWQTSWQQLKDHVRNVCPVERVEVFNDSTSGWVSVWGRDNFEVALRLLNGGVFNGRALLADGKNATETVMIKELVNVSAISGSSPKTPRTQRYTIPPSVQYASGTPPMMSSTTAGYGEWTTTSTNTTASIMPRVDCASYTAPTTLPRGYGETTTYIPRDISNSGYYGQLATMPVSMAQYPYQTSYSQQYPAGEHQNSNYSMYRGGMAAAPGYKVERPIGTPASVVPTEMRKIIIKQIQPSTTYRQVKDLIRQKAGSDADKLQQIDLPPTDGQRGANNRGYALVTFRTQDAANKIIRKLNGYEYNGRRLEVEFTKEGVSKNEVATTNTITAATTATTTTTQSSSARGSSGGGHHHGHGHHSSSHHHHHHHHHRERRAAGDKTERRGGGGGSGEDNNRDYHQRSSHRDRRDKREQQGSKGGSSSTGGVGVSSGGTNYGSADKDRDKDKDKEEVTAEDQKSDVIIAHGTSASASVSSSKSGKKN
ncbi:hypothetical protein F5X99DRAFT_407798 [Biscogniauxia marginata]|nr:hypothetical protein F5X99DRAFT_407798 [Biscogniauxia marginata]